MTTDPKEVNKVIDRQKKKPARKPTKSINDLPVVKKKLVTAEKKLIAFKKTSQSLIVAAKSLAKLCETKKAAR